MGAPFFLSSFIKYCFEKRPSHFCAKKVALSAHKIISLCIYYLHYNFFHKKVALWAEKCHNCRNFFKSVSEGQRPQYAKVSTPLFVIWQCLRQPILNKILCGSKSISTFGKLAAVKLKLCDSKPTKKWWPKLLERPSTDTLQSARTKFSTPLRFTEALPPSLTSLSLTMETLHKCWISTEQSRRCMKHIY